MLLTLCNQNEMIKSQDDRSYSDVSLSVCYLFTSFMLRDRHGGLSTCQIAVDIPQLPDTCQYRKIMRSAHVPRDER